MLPTKIIQLGQQLAQERIIDTVLRPYARLDRLPLALRLLDRFPALRWLPARIIGLGFRREKVRSPIA